MLVNIRVMVLWEVTPRITHNIFNVDDDAGSSPPPKKKARTYHTTQHRSPEDLYSYYSIILHHGFAENKAIVRYTTSVYMEQVTVINKRRPILVGYLV